MPDHRALQTFVEVARSGSFTRAAKSMALSVGAISKAISRLEAQLQIKLFVRTTRRVHLTDEGLRLFDVIAASYDHIQAALSVTRSGEATLRGTVRVSAASGWARRLLIPVLADFFAEHPEIHIVLTVRDAPQGAERQAEDIRVSWGQAFEPGKVARVVQRMRLVLVASPDYLNLKGRPDAPEDLDGLDWIVAEHESGPPFGWSLRDPADPSRRVRRFRGAPSNRLVVRGEVDITLEAAVAGLGVTVVARDMIDAYLASGRLELVLPDLEVEGGAVRNTTLVLQHPPERELSRSAVALLRFLRGRLFERPRP
jgi:DNA-binding transcriptional LysR family regulator